nr:endonuclease VII domain-containing protein [Skermania sp. ID1734]
MAISAQKHANHVLRVYNLAPADFVALWRIQGGSCAICRRANGTTRRLSVDHCHRTGQVRGLLCRPCNSALAQWVRENRPAAILYVTNPPARRLHHNPHAKPLAA